MRIHFEGNRIERSIKRTTKHNEKYRHTPTDRQVPLNERRENSP